MPINVYTGLMRSGKSYEVVSEVILPAILSGRDVVTNVDGISQDRIHDYLFLKNPTSDRSKYGLVRHVTNEDVFSPEFFPYYDDLKNAHVDTMVRPGDLVCIDEAWRFWGSDCKLHKHHKSFFLEHGHFTHPVTHIACDLVLMIQDMGTLHRMLRAVVAFSFRTHKKVSLGLTNTYSLQMWEGSKLVRATEAGNWVRRYNKEIFPLYSSFKGGADGKLVNADKRQNIFSNKMLIFKGIGLLVVIVIGGYNMSKFFKGGQLSSPDQKSKPNQNNTAPLTPSPVASLPASELSEWRIAGSILVRGESMVILLDSSGHMRLESPSNFHHNGLEMVGRIDGKLVTTYSGQPVSNSNSFLSSGDKK